MRELGAAGGRARTRAVAGISDELADETLRNLGRKRLEALVKSDNEQIALRASTALYSYRSIAPPAETQNEYMQRPPHVGVSAKAVLKILRDAGAFDSYEDPELESILQQGLEQPLLDGRQVTTIADVIDFATENGSLTAMPPLADAIRRAYRSLPLDADEAQAAERFAEQVTSLAERKRVEPEPVLTPAKSAELDSWRSGNEAA